MDFRKRKLPPVRAGPYAPGLTPSIANVTSSGIVTLKKPLFACSYFQYFQKTLEQDFLTCGCATFVAGSITDFLSGGRCRRNKKRMKHYTKKRTAGSNK